jgi:hypothetical protein
MLLAISPNSKKKKEKKNCFWKIIKVSIKEIEL